MRKPAEEAEERSEAEVQGGRQSRDRQAFQDRAGGMMGINEGEALGSAARDLG